MDAAQLGMFEQACAELQSGDAGARAAAEAMLMQMRTSEQAAAVAASAVQGASSGAAKFQAALILRDAALRDWARTPKPERERVRDELLSYTMASHAGLEGFVVRQLLQVVALLVKRGWLDDAPPAAALAAAASAGGADSPAAQAAANRDARLAALGGGSAAAAVFDRLPSLLASGDLASQNVGGQLLLTLTGEFSFTRASAVGLAWEEHARARAGFEMGALQRVFSMAIDVLEQHAHVAVQCGGGGPQYEEWLRAWLGVLSAVLSWDFATASDSEAVLAGMVSSRLKKGGADSAEVVWLTPGAGWRAALTDGRLLTLLFGLCEATAPVRQDASGALAPGVSDTSLGNSARFCLLTVSNLEGPVFESRVSRTAFYNAFLSQTLGWLESSVGAAQRITTDEDVDVARDAARVVLDGLTVVERLFHNLAKYRDVLFIAWDDGAGDSPAAAGAAGVAPELGRLLAQLERAAAFALASLGDGSDGGDMDMLVARAESCSEWRDELVHKVLCCWGNLVPQAGVQPRAATQQHPCYAAAAGVLRGSTAGLIEGLVRWRVGRASLLGGLRWSVSDNESADSSSRTSGGEESESDLTARLGRFVLGGTLSVLCETLGEQLMVLREVATTTVTGSDGAKRRAEGAVGCLMEMGAAVLTHAPMVSSGMGIAFMPCKLPDEVVTLSLAAEQQDTSCPIASTLQSLHEGAGMLNYLLRHGTSALAPEPPASGPPPPSPGPGQKSTPFLSTNLPPEARGGSPSTPRRADAAAGEPVVSEKLLAVVLEALGRICGSYLGLSDLRSAMLYPRGIGSQLQQAVSCNEGGGGQLVVGLYVGLASQALQSVSETSDKKAKKGATAAEAASSLLQRLAQQNVVRHHLLVIDDWLNLAQGYAAGGGILGSHSGRVKRALGCALATAGLTSEPAEGYLMALRGALVTPLFSLAGEGLGAAIALQGAPATLAALCHFLQGLRGVAGAEAHSTHTAAVLNVLGLLEALPLLAPLIEGCAGAAPGRPAIDVMVCCIKLLATLVETHGDDLGEITDPTCATVYQATNNCLEVVGRVACAMDTAASTGDTATALHLRYRTVKALLKVAVVFWPRAICGEEDGEGVAVAELLFRLVSVLLPSVDTELLQIPAVCHGYFELWQFLVDLYPGRVATLPPALFTSLIQSLEWGLATDVEAEVTQRVCLQTMAAMAEHAFKALQDSDRGNANSNAEALLGAGTQVRDITAP